MRNSISATLVLVLLFSGAANNVANARVTGTNPTGSSADTWCEGPSGAEVCVDYLGDIIPTTNNDAALGTLALQWSSVYANTINTGSGGHTITGDLAVSGSTTLSGKLIYTKTALGTSGGTTGIYISTTIPYTSIYETLVSSNGNITLTSTPSIATMTAAGVPFASGSFLILSSTVSASVTFQDEGTLSGSKLQLGASTRTLGQFDTLQLIFDAADGYWREVSYGNN